MALLAGYSEKLYSRIFELFLAAVAELRIDSPEMADLPLLEHLSLLLMVDFEFAAWIAFRKYFRNALIKGKVRNKKYIIYCSMLIFF